MYPTRFASLSLCCLASLALACGDDGGGNATGTGTDTATGSTTTSGTETTTSTGTESTTTSSTTDPTSSTTDDSTSGGSTGTTGGMLACPYTENPDAMPTVDFELVADGFNRPVLAVGHPTEPDQLFVVEQNGNVKLLGPDDTSAPAENYLTIDVVNSGTTVVGSEVGLLGFALHPNYPDDPRVYVASNPNEGNLVTAVDEFTESNGTATFTRRVIAADQPAGNHNGGMIEFGADGYLYIALGDGGDGNDAFNTGRNTGQILAKILRIDVEPDGVMRTVESCDICDDLQFNSYSIPDDNPFVNDTNFAPEVWAWGFRNPWRFSFDPADGSTMYVADVGQGNREEVAIVAAGEDHGWSDMEGLACFGGGCDDTPNPGEVNTDGQTLPVADYDHGQGRCSITGLGVYRSCEVPAFDGYYFYADYCNGQVFGVLVEDNSITGTPEVFNFNGELPLGGGTNAYGDVYLTTAVAGAPGTQFSDGRVYRLTAQ